MPRRNRKPTLGRWGADVILLPPTGIRPFNFDLLLAKELHTYWKGNHYIAIQERDRSSLYSLHQITGVSDGDVEYASNVSFHISRNDLDVSPVTAETIDVLVKYFGNS
jgi:hypothetical protein